MTALPQQRPRGSRDRSESLARGRRRNHSAAFKAQVAIVVLNGNKTDERAGIMKEEEEKLNETLRMLKDASCLEFTGEYGNELTTFIPLVAWLKREGYLKGCRIITYDGMRPYYFFLSDDEIQFKTADRIWLPSQQRYWPTNATETAISSPWHVYPDYRSHFGSSSLPFTKPILFIQNKFTVDYQIGPVNFLPLYAIEKIINTFSNEYDIVYSRPSKLLQKYSFDHNTICDYPDRAVVAKFSNIFDLEHMSISNNLDYNMLKLQTLSKSSLFVAAQGGGAHLLAYFGNSIMLLFDRLSLEYPHAYAHGPYKYLSPDPVKLMVARTGEKLANGVDILYQAASAGTSLTTDGFKALASELFI